MRPVWLFLFALALLNLLVAIVVATGAPSSTQGLLIDLASRDVVAGTITAPENQVGLLESLLSSEPIDGDWQVPGDSGQQRNLNRIITSPQMGTEKVSRHHDQTVLYALANQEERNVLFAGSSSANSSVIRSNLNELRGYRYERTEGPELFDRLTPASVLDRSPYFKDLDLLTILNGSTPDSECVRPRTISATGASFAQDTREMEGALASLPDELHWLSTESGALNSATRPAKQNGEKDLQNIRQLQFRQASKSADDFGINWDSLSDDGIQLRNYAVVIGINDYSNRMKLRSCVNDADAMAKILDELDYRVIKLTDSTAEGPTKRNILDMALEDIRHKPDRGKTVIYFSGHCERDGNGNLYLIPKDASSDPSSYISEGEFKARIQDIGNLALIIDTCYSGGWSDCIENGQIILTSSSEDQVSNEDWFGSMSVFTQYLCLAIEAARASGEELSIQRCFEEARENTSRWSRLHLISQMPQISDRTGGQFELAVQSG